MTPHIKKEIKARQRAFTSGNVTKHKELSEKVSVFIKRAKKECYHFKAKGQRNHNSTRWYCRCRTAFEENGRKKRRKRHAFHR